MKIEMNKQYRTRAGKKVRILCVDREHDVFTVVVLIDEGETENIERYSQSGKYYGDDTNESSLDLIEASPWDYFKVDDKVLVWNYEGDKPVKRHFAGISDDGRPKAFNGGTSSWNNTGVSLWDNCVKCAEVK